MRIDVLFKKKIILFILQFSILSLFIFIFNYQFRVEFSLNTDYFQKIIVQTLANYVLFLTIEQGLFIYSIWLLVSLLPLIIDLELKKVYSTNLISYFILNFFCYVFSFRYAVEFIDSFFISLFTNTILLGLIVLIYSVLLSLIKKKIKANKQESNRKMGFDSGKPLSICPKCGTEFGSIPLFCYNCNSKIILDEHDSNEE